MNTTPDAAPDTLPFLLDPAFIVCFQQALGNQELVANFDRLRGTNLSGAGSPLALAIDQATGRLDSDMQAFADFVSECIYQRLDGSALDSLRARAAEGLLGAAD